MAIFIFIYMEEQNQTSKKINKANLNSYAVGETVQIGQQIFVVADNCAGVGWVEAIGLLQKVAHASSKKKEK